MFLLRFYNTLVSKTAALLKTVYNYYIYQECTSTFKQITYFSPLNLKLVFFGVLFQSDRSKNLWHEK